MTTLSPTVRPLLVTVLDTPVGRLLVATDADGVVRRSGFGEPGVLLAGIPGPVVVPAADLPGVAVAAVARYLAGELDALDAVPAAQPGGVFQQAAWVAMREIPAGTTVTYAALAARSGRPTAVRAAGSACARNRLAPFVPCHRVLRTDGGLGGYAFGLDVKRALLDHERRHAPA